MSVHKLVFFIRSRTGTTVGRTRTVKSCLGDLPIREKQAKKLVVKPWTQISEHLKKCRLLVNANNSYQRTKEDLVLLTGMRISASTQQRLVQRQAI